MTESNEMMNQDAIDALIGKNVSKKAPAHGMVAASKTQTMQHPDIPDEPPVKMAAQPPPKQYKSAAPAADHEECIAAGEIQAMTAQISDLLFRISRLEVAVSKQDGGNGAKTNDMTMVHMKAAVAQIKNIGSQVEIISEGLRGTAGYNVNKTFKCGSCNTVGVVAVKVKCNQCGQENWWGWWPKKK
jgi:hypothetical protein